MPSRKKPVRTQYDLPAIDLPKSLQKKLHPWVAGFIGLSPAKATRRLQQRWADIKRPALKALRKTLSNFEVRAILVDGTGGQIYAERPDSEQTIGNSFYLPGPLDPKELRGNLQSFGLAANPSVAEFLKHFAGLAEDTEVAGNFVYRESPWPSFTDSWDDSIDGFEVWENSLILYHARNGCMLLIHPTGRVAWWVMQESAVEQIAANFDEFVRKFNKHRKGAWPFDPYGPP
jgi:hypothetical protein